MNSEDLRKLKFNRLKPEEQFMLSIFDGLVKISSSKHEKDFLYIKNDYCYFYHNSEKDFLYFDYDKNYTVLEKQFGMDYIRICNLLTYVSEYYLKIKIMPILKNNFGLHTVQEYLDITKISFDDYANLYPFIAEEHLKIKNIGYELSTVKRTEV